MAQDPDDLLDFERDCPDLVGIRIPRDVAPLTDDWLQELTDLVAQFPNVGEILDRRPTSEGWEPFEL